MRRSLLLLVPFCGLAPFLFACPTDVGSGDSGADQTPPPGPGPGGGNPDARATGPQPDSGAITNPAHDAGPSNAHDAGPPQPAHDGGSPAPGPDAGTPGGVSGNVSGLWSGMVNVTGNVIVPQGQTLEIAAGTQVLFPDTISLTVNGTLKLSGTTQSRIALTGSATRWIGLKINGTLQGSGADISKGSLCIAGLAGSMINIDHVNMTDCSLSLRLENGGTFAYTHITGGQTVSVTGGVLNMTDSVIDLQQTSNQSIDCTDWAGGSATLDHVRFTACHCPLHFNSTTSPITVTNSILDVAAVPIMIANSQATITHNNIIGPPQLDDIGGSINANVAGNYWGGGAPTVITGNMAQFVGADMYSTTAFTDVGPRP